jgi:tRNA(fMet)-specific endonuclease VapC
MPGSPTLVLDTDVFSIVTRADTPKAARVLDRLRASGERDAITIVTVEERMRGRLAACHRATDPEQYVIAARHLHETLEECGTVHVPDFTPGAVGEFRRLKAARIRIGTSDLCIAAIVLANNATLITSNLSDFRKVR